ALDDPEKTEERWREATKKLISGATSAKPAKPPSSGEEEPPEATGEDLAWYRDNTSIGPFDAAPVFETRHYLLKTNVKKEHARRYAEMLDSYFDVFVGIFTPAQIPSKKSEVWIYATRDEYGDATGLGGKAAGFYSFDTRRVTAYHGLTNSGEPTRNVL